MFQLSDVLQPKPGERTERVIRQHFFAILPRLLVAGFLIVFPFFVLFSLLRSAMGVIFLTLCVLIGFTMAVRALLVWDADVLVVTTHRLIDVDQRGIWTRIVTEIPLISVSSLEILSGKGMGLLGGIGGLRIHSTGAPSVLDVSMIRKPERIRNLILELKEKTQK